MTWVWNCSKSKNAARLVLLAIADSASSDDGHANLSIKGLQRKANLGSERTVQDAVKSLIKLGELDVRYNAGLGGCNVYIVHWDPAESAGVLAERKLQVKARTPAKSAPPQNLRGGAKSAGAYSPESSQVGGADPADIAPPQNLHPAESADGPIGRKEGSPPTYLPQPTDRARGEAGRQEGARPIEKQIADFIAALDLDRIPDMDEQARIANLVIEKLDGGWTAAELKRSIDGRWANADSRIALVISRLRKLNDAPLRRSAPKAAPLAECARCDIPTRQLGADGLCDACRARAARPSVDDIWEDANEVLREAGDRERANAESAARDAGLTDQRAIAIYAAEYHLALEKRAAQDQTDERP